MTVFLRNEEGSKSFLKFIYSQGYKIYYNVITLGVQKFFYGCPNLTFL